MTACATRQVVRRSGDDSAGNVDENFTTSPTANFHESVKTAHSDEVPVQTGDALGGVVLDPFLGSGPRLLRQSSRVRVLAAS